MALLAVTTLVISALVYHVGFILQDVYESKLDAEGLSQIPTLQFFFNDVEKTMKALFLMFCFCCLGRPNFTPKRVSRTTTTIQTRTVPVGVEDDASSTTSATTSVQNDSACPRCSSAGWDRDSSPSASEYLVSNIYYIKYVTFDIS